MTPGHNSIASDVRLNANEEKVLAALAASYSEDFGYIGFAGVSRRTRLSRREVRRACRSLTRKGLAQFARGLWTENGRTAGSGYAATKAGYDRADKRAVERIELREWP